MQNLDYKDVFLIPSYSACRTRRELDVSVDFLGHKFASPAIPANMRACIDFDMAEKLDSYNLFYILHRFYDYQEILDWIKKNQDLNCISISIGVKDVDKKLVDDIDCNDLRVDFITIDVASGDNILMKEMISYVKDRLFNTKIIAGNVGTIEGALRLQEWGASAIKVGLGFGKSCSTYNCTGVGTPMFSTINDISTYEDPSSIPLGVSLQQLRDGIQRKKNYSLEIPVIADGGIREVGDVCKSLVAGATMSMIGSGFCACIDSTAETKEWKYEYYEENEEGTEMTGVNPISINKVYFGSASAKNKGKDEYTEGWDEVLLPCNGLTYLQYYQKIKEGVQSCMSYAGVEDIKDLKNMKWEVYTK